MNVAVDRRYTDEDQQMDYPGDLGFQFVNGIQEAQIYWGRSPSSTEQPVTRKPDWQALLDAFLAEHQFDSFQYGRWDCCLFVCDAILAMTGVDPAAAYRGTYSSRAESRRHGVGSGERGGRVRQTRYAGGTRAFRAARRRGAGPQAPELFAGSGGAEWARDRSDVVGRPLASAAWICGSCLARLKTDG